MAELIKRVISEVDRIFDLSGAELDPNVAGYTNFGDSSIYRSRTDGSLWIFQNGAWQRFDIRAPAGTSGFLNPIDIPPLSPNAADDEYNVGSAIDTAGTRRTGATAWTAFNHGGFITGSLVDDSLIITYSGGAGVQVRGWTQPLAAGTFTYRMRLINITRDAPTAGDFYSGIFLRESATGKLISWSMGRIPADTQNTLKVIRWTSASVIASTPLSATPINQSPDNKYLGIERDGSGNLKFFFSSEGRIFVISHTELQTAHFTTAPDEIGIFLVAGSAGSYGLHGWFRRYA